MPSLMAEKPCGVENLTPLAVLLLAFFVEFSELLLGLEPDMQCFRMAMLGYVVLDFKALKRSRN